MSDGYKVIIKGYGNVSIHDMEVDYPYCYEKVCNNDPNYKSILAIVRAIRDNPPVEREVLEKLYYIDEEIKKLKERIDGK